VIFDFDLGKLAPPGLVAQLDETAARSLLSSVADMARAHWIQLAQQKFHRTAADYIRAIQPVELGDNVASVTLMGSWPNKLETGFPPYDLRTTLLGPNVPVVGPGERGKHANKSGGFYRSISFRFSGPASTGRTAQRVTDTYAKQLGEERAKKLGRMAWKEMRRLDPTLSNPGEKTKWGERLKTAGTALEVRGRSHSLVDGKFTPHGGAEHKNPLFEGAVRMQQTYQRATQAFHGTFRTISTSTTEGWIHPGYEGARLAEEVARFIEQKGPDMVAFALEQASVQR